MTGSSATPPTQGSNLRETASAHLRSYESFASSRAQHGKLIHRWHRDASQFIKTPVRRYVEHAAYHEPQLAGSSFDDYWGKQSIEWIAKQGSPRVYEAFLQLYVAIARAIEYQHTMEPSPRSETRAGWPRMVPFRAQSAKVAKTNEAMEAELARIALAAPRWARGTPWPDLLWLMNEVFANGGVRELRNNTSHLNPLAAKHHPQVVRALLGLLLPWRYMRMVWREPPSWGCSEPAFSIHAAAGSSEHRPILPGSAVDILGWYGYLLYAVDASPEESDASLVDLDALRGLEPSRLQHLVPLFPFVVAPVMLARNPILDGQLRTRLLQESGSREYLEEKRAQLAADALGLVRGLCTGGNGNYLHVSFPTWPEWAMKTNYAETHIGRNHFSERFMPCEPTGRSFAWLDTGGLASAGLDRPLNLIREIHAATLLPVSQRPPSGGERGTALLTYVTTPSGALVGSNRREGIRTLQIPVFMDIAREAPTPRDLVPQRNLVLPGVPLVISEALRERIVDAASDSGHGVPEGLPGLSGELYAVDTLSEDGRYYQPDDWLSIERILRLLRPVARGCPWLPDLYGRGTWIHRGSSQSGVMDHAILLHHEATEAVDDESWHPFADALLADEQLWSNDTMRLTWATWIALSLGRALKALDDDPAFPRSVSASDGQRDEVEQEGAREVRAGARGIGLKHGHVTPDHVVFHFSMSRIVLRDFSFGAQALSERGAAARRYGYSDDGGDDAKAFVRFAHDVVHLGITGHVPGMQDLPRGLEKEALATRKAELKRWLQNSFGRSAFVGDAWGAQIARCLGEPLFGEDGERYSRAREALGTLLDLLADIDGPASNRNEVVRRLEQAFEWLLAVLELHMLRELRELARGDAAPASDLKSKQKILRARRLLPGWDGASSRAADLLPTHTGADADADPLHRAWAAISNRLGATGADPLAPDHRACRPGSQRQRGSQFLSVVADAFDGRWQQRRCHRAGREGATLGGPCYFALPMTCPCTRPVRAALAGVIAGVNAGPAEDEEPHSAATRPGEQPLLELVRLLTERRNAKVATN